jgi:hypothetical protein
MRYTTEHLYKINPKSFIGKPYEEVLQEKLEALKSRRVELATKLRDLQKDSVGYEELSAINYELMYIDGAEEDHKFLLDEIGVSYE